VLVMVLKRRKKQTKIKILGAGREVGRSAIMIEHKDTRLLFDYGVAIGKEEPSFPLHVSPKSLDAVFLTHAHLDHSGALPFLYISEAKPLYTTVLTLEFSSILIRDFLKISKFYVPFEMIELENMVRHVKLVNYGESISIKDAEIEVIDAGHIPGSCMFKIRLDGLNILYTGDYNTTNTCLLKGADLNVLKDVDILITEGTYANFDHPSRDKIEKIFVEKLKEVLDNGGTVLIPAFAVGRSQEIMCVLAKYDIGYPIYIDGMARAIAELMYHYREYLGSPELFEEAFKRVKFISGWQMRKRAIKRPSIIISPAGMLKGGASVFYMEKIFDNPKNAVFFVSYLIEETPARRIIEEGVFSTRKGVGPVRARIEWFDFSSHISRKGLCDVINALSQHAKIILVHSSEDEGENFISSCIKNTGLKVYFPENGKELIFEK